MTCFLYGGVRKRIRRLTMRTMSSLRVSNQRRTKKIRSRGRRGLSSREIKLCRNFKIEAGFQES
jgi:hypothetical protein